MSMEAIQYTGYGIDISQVISALSKAAQEEFQDALWDMDNPVNYGVPNTDEVDIIVPMNTDTFTLLFLIPNVYAVRAPGMLPVKTYTKSEANTLITQEINYFFNSLHENGWHVSLAKIRNKKRHKRPLVRTSRI